MKILLPDGMIDPHIHLWDPLTTYRQATLEAHLLHRVTKIPRVARWLMPKRDRQFIGHPHHVLKPYLPQDYRANAGSLPIATVVHIEADWPRRTPHDSVEETRWICGLPLGEQGTPKLGAIVAQIDPRWPNAAAILDAHLAVTPLVRGVRCIASHHPDPGVRNFVDQPGILTERAFLRGFSAIAQRGLSFELWCYAHQLPEALTLVREYPETTFVLNHYSTPVGLFGRRGQHTSRPLWPTRAAHRPQQQSTCRAVGPLA